LPKIGEGFREWLKSLLKDKKGLGLLVKTGALGVTVFFGSFSSDVRRNERTARTKPNLFEFCRVVRELDHNQMNIPFGPFQKGHLSGETERKRMCFW
jgi:hypothetical protein